MDRLEVSPGVPAGLPTDLLNRLRNTLRKCPEFSSDERLRAIFTDARIAPWVNGVPEASNLDARVSLTISYLYKYRDTSGNSALVLLLRVLYDQVHEKADLSRTLSTLADEVEKFLEGWQSKVSVTPLQSCIPETVSVLAGEFWMGSEPGERLAFGNEPPRRKVMLPAFAIGKYPVTNAEYLAFVTATDHRSPAHWPSNKQFPPGKAHHPVVNVNFWDAQAYCKWLTEKTGDHCRLPTEEEWEKAARGGLPETRRYPWGDEWNTSFANTKNADSGDTTPVDAHEDKNHSPFDVVDMAGNAWEWTCTPYEGDRYVIRGGSFRYGPRYARNSCRGRCEPDKLDPDLGFRIIQKRGG